MLARALYTPYATSGHGLALPVPRPPRANTSVPAGRTATASRHRWPAARPGSRSRPRPAPPAYGPAPRAAAPWWPGRCRGRGCTARRPARPRPASRSAAGTTSSARPSVAGLGGAGCCGRSRQISSARGRPTRSTSGLVPVRSGTRPSAGSFMQNTRVVGGHPQVTGQRQLEAAADRVPAYGRDRDDVRAAQPQVTGLVAGDGGLEAGVGRAGQLLAGDAVRGEQAQVDAGREGRPLAADDDHPGRGGQRVADRRPARATWTATSRCAARAGSG